MSDKRGQWRVGVIGAGRVAELHLRALAGVPDARAVAIADIDRSAAERLAAQFEIEHVVSGHGELLELKIDVAHNCTPNTAHAVVNTAVLEAGCHLLAEKPLAISSVESGALVELERRRAGNGVVVAVCFTRRHLPAVKDLREAVASQRHGPLHLVRAGYAQDWLLGENDWNWRLDPALSGPSATVADIGSHVLDLVEHVSGQRIVELVASLGTLHATRLAGSPPVARPVATEDHAAILARLASGIQTYVELTQVSAGHRDQMSIELSCRDATLAWAYEEPTVIRIGRRGEGFSAVPVPDRNGQAFDHAVSDFYRAVRGDDREGLPLASFADGHRSVRLVEAILESNRSRTWSTLEER